MRIFHNPNLNFVKWRFHALVMSALIIAAGVFTVVSRGGVPLGVDFSGGTVLVLKFVQPVSEEAVRKALPSAGDAVVQTIGAPAENKIMIRLPMMQEAESGANLEAKALEVESALRAAHVGDFAEESKDIVGPVMGKDLRTKGIYATLASLAGILAYVWFRFRFTFAVGAVIATFHDVLITMAFLVWFGYDLSLNIVAALLTITGYSVNDTIVIFDRVRENQRTAKKESLEEVVNRSVNQTLVADDYHGGDDVRRGRVALRAGGRSAARAGVHAARRHHLRHLLLGVHRVGHCDHPEPQDADRAGAFSRGRAGQARLTTGRASGHRGAARRGSGTHGVPARVLHRAPAAGGARRRV